MIVNISKYILFLLLNFLYQLNADENIPSKGKCIYMISDSSAYNFYYLKKKPGEEK
jgi:hypothetical protein